MQQFPVIMVTDPQTQPETHKQTGPITIHCAAASAQCNKAFAFGAELKILVPFLPQHVR